MSPRVGKDGRTMPSTPAIVRLLARVDTSDIKACWSWPGVTTWNGYGQMTYSASRGRQLVHRVSYEAYVGPIPDGLVIDHLCRNRLCVNPAHMEAVTQAENLRRSDLTPQAINAAKTHCKRGHEFTPENTMSNGQGNRACRECHRMHSARSYREKQIAKAAA